MTKYLPPLSVLFIWHPADETIARPLVEHCFSFLSRDINKPFSRAMNLPIFYRTSSKKGIPAKIDILSDKTVIFIFTSKEVAADDSWVKYIEDISKIEGVYIIPIALDNLAFGIKGALDKTNFIRTYDFEQLYLKDYLFISVAHEIYRYTLNDSFKEIAMGKDKALKIFISHAKDGKNGIKLAKALKEFIDNSPMRNFFDATDIAPGYKFDEEIIGHIKESSIIAIHSDLYSSRYWCQREILCAKENNRPIVAVDGLEEFEDRRFPFASNVPAIRVHLNVEPKKKDLLRILCLTLLETVRFFYSRLLLEQYKYAGWLTQDTKILSRPPEVSDIDKLLFEDGSNIRYKHNSLAYPEPPLYSEELFFLSKLGIKINTPLTTHLCPLQDKNIGISVSDPSEEELIAIGQSSAHLTQLSQDLARYLLARGAILIYGGDLREDGFTEFIFNEANALQTRMQSQNIHLNNYIAWPIYKNNTFDIKNWKAKYRPIAKMCEVSPPLDIKDLIPSEEVFLPPTNPQNLYVWSRCLTEMRMKMIGNCDIRICAGGKHSGYKGRMPGVLEEIIIAVEMKCPLFLLGGFGGITSSVCKFIQDGILPQELTEDWQIQNNPEYKELLNYGLSRDIQYSTNYNDLMETLKSVDFNNGLNDEDNIKLFHTPFVEEAMHLIFKGLKSIFMNEKL